MSASNWRVAAVLAFASLSAANAAPLSGSDLAGRERDRFVDPPIGRMIQQPPSVAPVFVAPRDCRDRVPRKAKTRRYRC